MTTITINIDDDGMIGGMTESELESIDVPASYEKYLNKVSGLVRERFPNARIEINICPCDIDIEIKGVDDFDLRSSVYNTVNNISNYIYAAGRFWVYR